MNCFSALKATLKAFVKSLFAYSNSDGDSELISEFEKINFELYLLKENRFSEINMKLYWL